MHTREESTYEPYVDDEFKSDASDGSYKSLKIQVEMHWRKNSQFDDVIDL